MTGTGLRTSYDSKTSSDPNRRKTRASSGFTRRRSLERTVECAAPSPSSSASSPASSDRSEGFSAWNWPARSKPFGAAVSEFEVGDEVFGVKGFGAHAEYVCVREAGALTHKPTG